MARWSLPPRWSRALDLSLWALLAGVLLYRFVLPVPSAPVSAALTSTRFETQGQPRLIEFSSHRCLACRAMGPVVQQLERETAGRVQSSIFYAEELGEEGQRLWRLAQVKVTPTFLIVDAAGTVRSRYEGTTPYLSLKRDLEALR